MSKLECQVQDMWDYIVNELPGNLDDSAEETGAPVRRKGVDSAANLLRIILTYGITNMSLKAVLLGRLPATWGNYLPLRCFFASEMRVISFHN